jgi:gamma-glutamylcyclotransferase (GGCT)/AIG2-like uncharacterized protein YtfP
VKIFTYGTLKPGEENYPRYCEGRVKNYQSAFTLGNLFDLPQGYPAMTSGNQRVYGYLLEFGDAEALSSLDELEDYHPAREESENLYYRVKQEIFLASEVREKFPQPQISLGLAWVYLMTESRVRQMRGKIVVGGCWHC